MARLGSSAGPVTEPGGPRPAEKVARSRHLPAPACAPSPEGPGAQAKTKMTKEDGCRGLATQREVHRPGTTGTCLRMPDLVRKAGSQASLWALVNQKGVSRGSQEIGTPQVWGALMSVHRLSQTFSSSLSFSSKTRLAEPHSPGPPPLTEEGTDMRCCVRATLVQVSEVPLLAPRVPLTNLPATAQRAYPTSQQGHAWSSTSQKGGTCPPGYVHECPQQLRTLVTAPEQRRRKCPLTREQIHATYYSQKVEYHAATGRKPREESHGCTRRRG